MQTSTDPVREFISGSPAFFHRDGELIHAMSEFSCDSANVIPAGRLSEMTSNFVIGPAIAGKNCKALKTDSAAVSHRIYESPGDRDRSIKTNWLWSEDVPDRKLTQYKVHLDGISFDRDGVVADSCPVYLLESDCVHFLLFCM